MGLRSCKQYFDFLQSLAFGFNDKNVYKRNGTKRKKCIYGKGDGGS